MNRYPGDVESGPLTSNLQELLIAETRKYYGYKSGKGRPRTSPSFTQLGSRAEGHRRTKTGRTGRSIRRLRGGSRTPTNASCRDVDIFKILQPERRPYTADSILPSPHERRNRRNRYKPSLGRNNKKKRRTQAALQMQKVFRGHQQRKKVFFLKHLWEYDSLLGSNTDSRYEQQIGMLTSLPKVSKSQHSTSSGLQENSLSGVGVSTIGLDSCSIASASTRNNEASVSRGDVDALRVAEIQRAYEKQLEEKRFRVLSEQKRKEAQRLAKHRKVLEAKEADLREREERLQGMLDEYKNQRRAKHVRQIPSLPLSTSSSEKSVVHIPEPTKLKPKLKQQNARNLERQSKARSMERKDKEPVPVRPSPKPRSRPWRSCQSQPRAKRESSKRKVDEESRAAIKVQSRYRGHLCRKESMKDLSEETSAECPSTYGGFLALNEEKEAEKEKEKEKPKAAATKGNLNELQLLMQQLNAFDFTLGRKLEEAENSTNRLILREQLDGQLSHVKFKRDRAAGNIQKMYRGHLVRLTTPVRRNSWSGGNTGDYYYDYYGESNQGLEEQYQYWTGDTPKSADTTQYWAPTPATDATANYFFEAGANAAEAGVELSNNQVEAGAEASEAYAGEVEQSNAPEEMWNEQGEAVYGEEEVEYQAEDYGLRPEEFENDDLADIGPEQVHVEEVPETAEEVVNEYPETEMKQEEAGQEYGVAGDPWGVEYETENVEENYDELVSRSLHQATEYDEEYAELEDVVKDDDMSNFFGADNHNYGYNQDEALPTVPLTDLPANSVDASGWSVKPGPDNEIYLYPEGESSSSKYSGTSEEKKTSPLTPVELAMDALYKSGYMCATKVKDMSTYLNQRIKVARSDGSADDVLLVQILADDKLRCKKEGKTFVKKKKFCWLTPPDLLALARNGSASSTSEKEKESSRRDSWKKDYNDEGEEYFYNQDTGETAWTIPEEEEVTSKAAEPEPVKKEERRRSSRFDTDLFNTHVQVKSSKAQKSDDHGLELF